MLRAFIAAVAATLCFGAPVAQAQPGMCDHHGTGKGNIYIHACARGPGGAAPDWRPVIDANGNKVYRPDKDGNPHLVYHCARHCGGGRSHVETTDPD